MPKKPPVKGFRSSLFASTLALLMLLGILLVSNTMQKAREGGGKYDFDEEMCFDISKEKDFDTEFTTAHDDQLKGTGALVLNYRDEIEAWTSVREEVSIMTAPLNGTIDGYGVSIARWYDPEDDPREETFSIDIGLNFTKKKILDLDITQISIYFNMIGVEFQTIRVSMSDRADGGTSVSLGTISLGNLTKIEIEVVDLLEINTFETDKNIVLRFTPSEEDIIPDGSVVIFDMQFYCIEEIKVPTLTKLGFYLGLGGIGYIFLGIVVSPEYTIEGIIDRIIKLSKGGK